MRNVKILKKYSDGLSYLVKKFEEDSQQGVFKVWQTSQDININFETGQVKIDGFCRKDIIVKIKTNDISIYHNEENGNNTGNNTIPSPYWLRSSDCKHCLGDYEQSKTPIISLYVNFEDRQSFNNTLESSIEVFRNCISQYPTSNIEIKMRDNINYPKYEEYHEDRFVSEATYYHSQKKARFHTRYEEELSFYSRIFMQLIVNEQGREIKYLEIMKQNRRDYRDYLDLESDDEYYELVLNKDTTKPHDISSSLNGISSDLLAGLEEIEFHGSMTSIISNLLFVTMMPNIKKYTFIDPSFKLNTAYGVNIFPSLPDGQTTVEVNHLEDGTKTLEIFTVDCIKKNLETLCSCIDAIYVDKWEEEIIEVDGVDTTVYFVDTIKNNDIAYENYLFKNKSNLSSSGVFDKVTVNFEVTSTMFNEMNLNTFTGISEVVHNRTGTYHDALHCGDRALEEWYFSPQSQIGDEATAGNFFAVQKGLDISADTEIGDYLWEEIFKSDVQVANDGKQTYISGTSFSASSGVSTNISSRVFRFLDTPLVDFPRKKLDILNNLNNNIKDLRLGADLIVDFISEYNPFDSDQYAKKLTGLESFMYGNEEVDVESMKIQGQLALAVDGREELFNERYYNIWIDEETGIEHTFKDERMDTDLQLYKGMLTEIDKSFVDTIVDVYSYFQDGFINHLKPEVKWRSLIKGAKIEFFEDVSVPDDEKEVVATMEIILDNGLYHLEVSGDLPYTGIPTEPMPNPNIVIYTFTPSADGSIEITWDNQSDIDPIFVTVDDKKIFMEEEV